MKTPPIFIKIFLYNDARHTFCSFIRTADPDLLILIFHCQQKVIRIVPVEYIYANSYFVGPFNNTWNAVKRIISTGHQGGGGIRSTEFPSVDAGIQLFLKCLECLNVSKWRG